MQRRDDERRLAQVRARNPWNSTVGRDVEEFQHRSLQALSAPVAPESFAAQLVDEPVQRGRRVVGALLDGVELSFPQLSVLVESL